MHYNNKTQYRSAALKILCFGIFSLLRISTYSQEVEIVEYKHIKEKVEQKDYTAVYLWRTWCGSDVEKISDINLLKKEFEKLGIEFICLSVMSDIEKQKDILSKINFNSKSYAIFSKYKSKPKIKAHAHIEIINSKFCPECDSAIFPSLYVYNNNMHIIYKITDEKPDIIVKALNDIIKLK